MREKLIDSALLAGMVIICVVILYTLFAPPTRSFERSTTSPQDEARIDVVSPIEDVPSNSLDTELMSETELPEVASAETTEAETSGSIAVLPANATSEETEALSEQAVDVAEPEEAEVEVLSPEESESATIGTEETSVSETAAESENSNGVSEQNGTLEAEAVQTDAELETPPPVPAGSFELERIGFSFVTGGAGACGIVLEAWQHVAVSRDILERYPCGSEITIVLDDPVDGRQTLNALVADTMNPVNIRTVNIYVATDEPALEYGVNTGILEP